MNIDRRFLDVRLRVYGTVNEPGAKLFDGIQYIVGDAPTGAFDGATPNQIAVYRDEKWKFYTPNEAQIELMDVVNAKWLRYDSENSKWVSFADVVGIPKNGEEKSTSVRIKAPVDVAVPTGDALPDNCEEGQRILNLTDGKVYTATAEDTWDNGDDSYTRVLDLGSGEILEKGEDGTFKVVEALEDGDMVASREDNTLFFNDDNEGIVGVAGSGSGPVNPGASNKAVVHELTADEAAAKAVILTLERGEKMDTFNCMMSFCGVVQTPGVDYEITYENHEATISWEDKGLEDCDPAEGDTLVILF